MVFVCDLQRKVIYKSRFHGRLLFFPIFYFLRKYAKESSNKNKKANSQGSESERDEQNKNDKSEKKQHFFLFK